jgi:hypothetical protein
MVSMKTGKLFSLVLALVALCLPSAAAERLAGRPGDPPLPPIPDAFDIDLTYEERERIRSGEIVVQIVERTPEDRQARAIGYLKNNPRALFRVSSDSALQEETFAEVEVFDELERWPDGSHFRARADVSWLLPAFNYEMVSGYDSSRTGLTWTQLEGDFQRNDGSQSFLWDPERGATLAVFTFDLALRGILSLVPEWVILRLAGGNLPATMRAVDGMVDTVRERDPEWRARLDAEWTELRARLAAGEFPGRVYREETE